MPEKILGVQTRQDSSGWLWTLPDESQWRWTVEGLSLWGQLASTRRQGWVQVEAPVSTLAAAVAYSLGWEAALRRLVDAKIEEIAPTLVRDARDVAARLSRAATENLGLGHQAPTSGDYARGADMLRSYRDSLESIVSTMLNGAVSIAVAAGNAAAEVSRLEALADVDIDIAPDPLPPAA